MWVNRRKYELIKRILMNDQMVVMTKEHYDNLVHEKNSLADKVEALTTERDQYKQRWQSLLHIRGEDKR